MRLADALWLVPRLGFDACAIQAGYRVKRKLGRLQAAFPTPSWDEAGLNRYGEDAAAFAADWRRRVGKFFFAPGGMTAARDFLRALPAEAREAVGAEADAIAAGRFRYFSDQEGALGTPPDWGLNPFNGRHAARDAHWTRIPDFDPEVGDVKLLWEPSRFGWVYALARAYALTGEARHAEVFWAWVEAWRAQNPPNVGPQWKCGQECAFRVMALAFGLFAFADAAATTEARVAMLAGMIAFHAERIEGNLAYAWSLRNNHGISEALGLYTAGVLLPTLAPARRWRERGGRLLEREGRRQIFDDGSFVQHSLNYHRLMLHDYAWALGLARANGLALGQDLVARVGRAARFLHALVDPVTGDVPNYGHNDGARILPLDAGGYRDFRGAVQLAGVAALGERLLPPGPWDEPVAWLHGSPPPGGRTGPQGQEGGTTWRRAPGGPPPCSSGAVPPPGAGELDFPAGGYYVVRGIESWGMVRCHAFHTRPAHADALHLDLWWRGVNVLQDAGTYHYAADPPWDRAFKGTAAHNTVMVDGRDQMRELGRWLWGDWTQAVSHGRRAFAAAEAEAWEGTSPAYAPVHHRRAVVRLGEAGWLVVDDLTGPGEHAAALHWHLPDVPWREEGLALRLDPPAGQVSLAVLAPAGTAGEVVRGGADGRGWRSPTYGAKHPAPSWRLAAQGPLPMRFVTAVGLGHEAGLRPTPDGVAVTLGDATFQIALATAGRTITAVTRS